MSDHEKRTAGGAGAGSGALVESATSRHKQPIRPLDMQDEEHKELHHKRSKAPAIPSATEDLKKDSVKNEKLESEQAITNEKQKHNVAKKLSSATKRREASPESLKLAPPAVDVKKSSKSAVQPIPDHAPMTGIEPKKKQDDTLEEEDSITEELRAPETARDTSEWTNKTGDSKKKGVSWNHEEYLSKVKLEDEDRSCHLERKSSLGPCFRAAAPFGRPSGIAICLANRPSKQANEKYLPKTSSINISLSRRLLVNKTILWDVKECPSTRMKEAKVPDKAKGPERSFLDAAKETFSNMGHKIKNIF